MKNQFSMKPNDLHPKQIASLYKGEVFQVTINTRSENPKSFFAVLDDFGISGNGRWCGYCLNDEFYEIELFAFDVDIKPILKRIENMEGYDRYKYYHLCKRIQGKGVRLHTCDTPHSFLYLITNGYDMFELIESGRALDASQYQKLTVKQPQI